MTSARHCKYDSFIYKKRAVPPFLSESHPKCLSSASRLDYYCLSPALRSPAVVSILTLHTYDATQLSNRALAPPTASHSQSIVPQRRNRTSRFHAPHGQHHPLFIRTHPTALGSVFSERTAGRVRDKDIPKSGCCYKIADQYWNRTAIQLPKHEPVEVRLDTSLASRETRPPLGEQAFKVGSQTTAFPYLSALPITAARGLPNRRWSELDTHPSASPTPPANLRCSFPQPTESPLIYRHPV